MSYDEPKVLSSQLTLCGLKGVDVGQGLVQGDYLQTKADFTSHGAAVTLRMKPNASVANQMTAVHLGHHNVLVSPSRFVDVVAGNGIGITLLTVGGHLIGNRGQIASPTIVELAKMHSEGSDGEQFFSVARNNELIAIVTRPRANMAVKVTQELIILLPIGAFIALFIVAIVVWLSRKRLSPEAELELAVRNREFVVHYQPIIELKSGICVGAEALVRWNRPDGTLVRPDLFIPLAEETGLIRQITDQVIDAVIEDLNTMLVNDRTLHIAINLCADDMQTGRVLNVLDEKLKYTGIRHEQIWLEATERGFMDMGAAKRTLSKARSSGHSVAIDDFGTGFSSLSYLQKLPLDALKIDKSFIDTIGRNTATSSVVLHVIEMAKDLGLFCVAEGIETQEQLDFLCDQAVDFGQGWLFSKPLPVGEFIQFQMMRRRDYGPAPEVIQVTNKE